MAPSRKQGDPAYTMAIFGKSGRVPDYTILLTYVVNAAHFRPEHGNQVQSVSRQNGSCTRSSSRWSRGWLTAFRYGWRFVVTRYT
jgi:hypothetical protein